MIATVGIAQFKRACHFHQFGSLIIGGLSLVVILGGFGIASAYKNSLTRFVAPMLGTKAADGATLAAFTIPGIVLLFGGFIWLEHKTKSIAGATCFHCKKCLAGMMHTVIASKHCPHCGRRVLSELIETDDHIS